MRETCWPKSDYKIYLNGNAPSQTLPSSLSMMFGATCLCNQLGSCCSSRGSYSHLAPASEGTRVKKGGCTMPQSSRWSQTPCVRDLALPLTGCVTLSKLLNPSQPVSSSVNWRLSSLSWLPHQIVVTGNRGCEIAYEWGSHVQLSSVIAMLVPTLSLCPIAFHLPYCSDSRAKCIILKSLTPLLPMVKASCPKPSPLTGSWVGE